METHNQGTYRAFCRKVTTVMISRAACLFWLVLASVLTAVGNPVFGAFLFLLGIIGLLVLSDDVMTVTLPVLLLAIFVLPNYNCYDLFIPYWWMVIPLAAAFVFHFVFFHREWRIGPTFPGILAVAVAVSCAGLFSGAGYSPTVLFYTVGLGVGMVVSYLLLASELDAEHGYDRAEVFSRIMISMGIFACVLLMKLWIIFLVTGGADPRVFQPSNNLGTFLLFALPFPLYGIHRLHGWRRLVPALLFMLFFSALLLTTSRGALIIAPVLAVISFILFAIVDDANRRGFVIAAVVGGVLSFGIIAALTAFGRDLGSGEFMLSGESRLRLIHASMRDFLTYPVFGVGLAGSRFTSAYQPVTGAMRWYHMMIPQVVGSMGIVGILAYGYQIVTRIRTYLIRIRPFPTVLVLSYFGIFLMSQVNPGEFCPVPYGLLTVMLFVLMEKCPKEG